MTAAAWLAWAGGTWMAIAIAAAWIKHRCRRRPPLPQRTPADVYRDVDQCRARRAEEQAADDLDNCWVIWPEARRAARAIEAQHRHDTAKQRKEEQ